MIGYTEIQVTVPSDKKQRIREMFLKYELETKQESKEKEVFFHFLSDKQLKKVLYFQALLRRKPLFQRIL